MFWNSCVDVTIPVVEQYRHGAYLRYALNSKKDIVMHHDGTHVEAIIDKGRHCNACQSDVGRMATLSSTRLLDNYVLDFQDDAYTMRVTGMGGFQYFCVFWCTRSRLIQGLRENMSATT